MIGRIGLALAVAGLLAGAASAQDTGPGPDPAPVGPKRAFNAQLSGGAEVPAVQTETGGFFSLVINRQRTEGDYQIRLRKAERVTQAHLHCAPAGSNGTIFAFLAGFHDRGWDVNGRWIDNATITNANILPAGANCPTPIRSLAELVNAIDQGLVYVNVHTVDNPGGEVRGQLRAVR